MRRAALLLLLLAPAFAQESGLPEDAALPEDGPALGELTRRTLDALSPSIVEVEALGGLPEEFKAPKSEEEAKEQGGILAAGGFKQAYGPTSGLIVREDGLILTTRFATQRNPRHLIVSLADGRSLVARTLGSDESRGLVLLQVDAKGLPVPRFAGPDALKVGRWALAMGRGLGRHEGAPTQAGAWPTVSRGIVSGLNRVGGRAIQTSAAVSPVNYGGPLCSIDGQVLGLLVPLSLDGGMASVDIYDSGIGFAIPAADLLRLIPRLQKGEQLVAGFLGVVPHTLSRDGVRVVGVQPGSPAAEAGIAEGDVILSVDGEKTDLAWQLRRALGARNAGDTLELQVRRQTTTRAVKVKLAKAPAPTPGERPPVEPEQDRR